MSDIGRAGVVTEVISGAVAGIASAEAAAAGEQEELFEIPSERQGDAPELARAREAVRRRGRPPGAVNKSTRAMREYLLRRGINPLESLMKWAMHTPQSLAEELGCTTIEAFRELRTLWEGLAPYFASKMMPVDDEGRPAPLFLMQFGQFGAPSSAGGKAPWLYLESEQNQSLATPLAPVSHGAVSHGEAK